MEPKRECLYDVEWQLTRISTLGKWTEEKTTQQAWSTLLAYCGGAKSETQEKFLRYWRCYNLLLAIPRGKGSSWSVILKARVALKRQYDRYRSLGYDWQEWDWAVVKAQLVALHHAHPNDWERLKLSMERRLSKVGQSSTVPYMQQKPEAAKFIRLMRDVEYES